MARPIVYVRVLSVVGSALLMVAIIASVGQESLIDGLRHVWSRRWGVTTLIDLYAGLALVGLWIASLERRVGRTLAWLAALVLLGNLATMVYLMVRSFRCATVGEVMLGRGGAQ